MVQVREARPDDAAQVARVHVASWQAAYRGLLPDEYLDGLDPADRMARYTFGATDPDAPSTIVAVDDGVICGFATTGRSPHSDTPDAGELLGLYVDPGAWDCGVGRRLMAEARERLSGGGFTEAVLWVLVGNERAERFYRIDGWWPDGRRRRDLVWGVTVDEVGYRRPLP
jgi:ribosomal protein S18 acetylase RimI-like enzyme